MFYFWLCYDDGQNMSIPERHPHSKSLVLYPEALCTQAWTQMNLMAVFNEDIFTAVGHDGFTDGSHFAHSSGHESRSKVGEVELFISIKVFSKMYCRQ